MFEQFHEEFIVKNCDKCNKVKIPKGRDLKPFKKYYGCPIYIKLHSAMMGMGEFPVKYIDKEKCSCCKEHRFMSNSSAVTEKLEKVDSDVVNDGLFKEKT